MRTLYDDEKNRLDALRRAMPALDARSQEFAGDLIAKAQTQKYGLTPAQWHWVDKLAERAAQPQPEMISIDAGLGGVVALLDRAAQHLKYPAIMVRAGERNLRLSVAGARSAAPGSINICGEGSFADRPWFGRVTRDGNFEPSRKHGAETATAIATALIQLAADPAGTASAYGRLMGVCCFCGLGLNDERSTAVGYGRTCASHYELPYPTMTQARAATSHADLIRNIAA